MRTLSASVGQGGRNAKADVVAVQELLNRVPAGEGGPAAALKVDGLAWDKTIAAIRRFQSANLGHRWPDARVDPGGKTLARLNDYDSAAPAARQFIHFVPGFKPVISQPSWSLTCWASTYAMMRSWREGKTYTVIEALARPGQPYIDLYKKDRALPPPLFRDFWTRCGMTVRGMAVFGDEIWYDLLTRHGLLAVGTASDMPPITGLHLRVMEGMSVCDTPKDCYYFIDPGWGGKKYPEPWFAFHAKFHNSMLLAGGAHWQVAHYY